MLSILVRYPPSTAGLSGLLQISRLCVANLAIMRVSFVFSECPDQGDALMQPDSRLPGIQEVPLSEANQLRRITPLFVLS